MITAVLFDADGVIQRPSATWRPSLESLCSDATRVESFLAEIFAAERPCVAGGADFAPALAVVLERWGCVLPVTQVLHMWSQIDPDPEALELVAALRRAGITVGLATNQQSYRAAYMSTGLGYAARFDHLFYSCELGASKPSHGFFQTALRRLARRPEEVLFVDDNEANVVAARQVGLHADVAGGAAAMAAILERHGLGRASAGSRKEVGADPELPGLHPHGARGDA